MLLIESCTFTYFPRGGMIMANVIEVILNKDDGTEERVSLDRVTKLHQKLQKKRGLNPNQELIDMLYRNAVAHYYGKNPDELTNTYAAALILIVQSGLALDVCLNVWMIIVDSVAMPVG